MFVPDLDLDFLPISDPGVKKAPDPESATLLVTMRCVLEEQERPVHSLPDNS